MRRPSLAPILIIIAASIIVMLLAPGIITHYAGSHTIHPTNITCGKCHSSQYDEVILSPHNDPESASPCICHGYNPSTNISLKYWSKNHNLSAGANCLDCHATNVIDYPDQECHYITDNETYLYGRAKNVT